MKYKREWCFGKLGGKDGADDFVVGYHAENGTRIQVHFLFGNENFRSYSVGDHFFDRLADAKAFIEGRA